MPDGSPPRGVATYEHIFCGGFPVLDGDEPTSWELRKAIVYSGSVAVDLPRRKQFRVLGDMTGGSSGSAAFRLHDGEPEPLGIMSAMILGFVGNQRIDSGLRIIWKWSIVEHLVGCSENEFVQLVAVV